MAEAPAENTIADVIREHVAGVVDVTEVQTIAAASSIPWAHRDNMWRVLRRLERCVPAPASQSPLDTTISVTYAARCTITAPHTSPLR